MEIIPIHGSFDKACVGSRVIQVEGFLDVLRRTIICFDWNTCRAPGQAKIDLTQEVNQYVSGGVGLKTANVDDYVLRLYRGKVGSYLQRRFALPVEKVSAIVYTWEAFTKDPEVTAEELSDYAKAGYPDYLLIAVLAGTEEEPPLTPGRLVSNLTGRNNEVATWTMEDVVEKARKSIEYWEKFHVVAD